LLLAKAEKEAEGLVNNYGMYVLKKCVRVRLVISVDCYFSSQYPPGWHSKKPVQNLVLEINKFNVSIIIIIITQKKV